MSGLVFIRRVESELESTCFGGVKHFHQDWENMYVHSRPIVISAERPLTESSTV